MIKREKKYKFPLYFPGKSSSISKNLKSATLAVVLKYNRYFLVY